jgi:hypothetical protein
VIRVGEGSTSSDRHETTILNLRKNHAWNSPSISYLLVPS